MTADDDGPLGSADELENKRNARDAEESTGRTIEDIAADGDDTEEPEEQPSLFGTVKQLSLAAGGKKKPTASYAKIRSVSEKIEGQFSPDDLVDLRVQCRVDKVEFGYIRDNVGEVTAVKRVHTLKSVGNVERMPAEYGALVDFARAIADGTLSGDEARDTALAVLAVEEAA